MLTIPSNEGVGENDVIVTYGALFGLYQVTLTVLEVALPP